MSQSSTEYFSCSESSGKTPSFNSFYTALDYDYDDDQPFWGECGGSGDGGEREQAASSWTNNQLAQHQRQRLLKQWGDENNMKTLDGVRLRRPQASIETTNSAEDTETESAIPWRGNFFLINSNGQVTNSTKTWKRFVLAVSLLGVVLLSSSDIILHFSSSPRATLAHRWESLLTRSGLQALFALIWCAISRTWPWQRLSKLPTLILLAITTSLLILSLDGASRRVSDTLQSTIQSLVPLPTLIFVMSLCLERFHFHRMIGMMCLVLAALLLNQPQWFGAKSVATPAVYNMDVLFALPINSRRLPENIYFQCLDQTRSGQQLPCAQDMTGFLHLLLSSIFSSYLLIVVFICQGVHVAVILFWMSLGSLAATTGGVLSTTSFEMLTNSITPSSLAWSTGSAVCGTLGTIFFILSIDKMGPFKSIMLRWLQFILVFVVNLTFGSGGRAFLMSDLLGCVLIGVAASHVIIEHLCY